MTEDEQKYIEYLQIRYYHSPFVLYKNKSGGYLVEDCHYKKLWDIEIKDKTGGFSMMAPESSSSYWMKHFGNRK